MSYDYQVMILKKGKQMVIKTIMMMTLMKMLIDGSSCIDMVCVVIVIIVPQMTRR